LGIALSSRPASPDAEIVLPSAVRIADVTLHGRATTLGGRARAVLESALHVARVLDKQDVETLRAGDKPGGLVVEAEEPWGFGLPEPEGGMSRGCPGA